MKRALSVLLTVVVLMSVMISTTSAEQEPKTVTNNEDNAITTNNVTDTSDKAIVYLVRNNQLFHIKDGKETFIDYVSTGEIGVDKYNNVVYLTPDFVVKYIFDTNKYPQKSETIFNNIDKNVRMLKFDNNIVVGFEYIDNDKIKIIGDFIKDSGNKYPVVVYEQAGIQFRVLKSGAYIRLSSAISRTAEYPIAVTADGDIVCINNEGYVYSISDVEHLPDFKASNFVKYSTGRDIVVKNGTAIGFLKSGGSGYYNSRKIYKLYENKYDYIDGTDMVFEKEEFSTELSQVAVYIVRNGALFYVRNGKEYFVDWIIDAGVNKYGDIFYINADGYAYFIHTETTERYILNQYYYPFYSASFVQIDGIVTEVAGTVKSGSKEEPFVEETLSAHDTNFGIERTFDTCESIIFYQKDNSLNVIKKGENILLADNLSKTSQYTIAATPRGSILYLCDNRDVYEIQNAEETAFMSVQNITPKLLSTSVKDIILTDNSASELLKLYGTRTDLLETIASIPQFPITINGTVINNTNANYPFLLYNGITYFPMTYTNARALGLVSDWTSEKGLTISLGKSSQTPLNTEHSSEKNALTNTVRIINSKVTVNGNVINNSSEEYPLLIFRDITYFPITWRWTSEFGWENAFDLYNGLSISTIK